MHLGLSLLSTSFSVSCRCVASPHLAHEGQLVCVPQMDVVLPLRDTLQVP